MACTVHPPPWSLHVLKSLEEERLWKEPHRDPWNSRELPVVYSESNPLIPKNSIWLDGWCPPIRGDGVPTDAQNEPHKQMLPALLHHEDSSSFVASLYQCAKQNDLHRGNMLHDKIQELGLLPKCLHALVHMFVKCGALGKAQELLDTHECRNVWSWTMLIDGYSRQGQGQKALDCFEKMQRNGISPDAVTYACILKASGSIKAVHKGKEIHDEVVRQGLLGTNVVLANALIDMYAKCGMLSVARRVLLEIPCRDVASWNVMIAGYIRQNQAKQALLCLETMRGEGFLPDGKTFACLLKACGSLKATKKGEQIHDEILAQRLLTKDTVLGNALVDMYAKCGALTKAHVVLDGLSSRDTVTWNTLISGYVQQGQHEQALSCFEQMQREGFSSDAVTFTCILKACGSIKEVEKGEQIHHKVKRRGLLKNNIVLCNALVDMYAKCGNLVKASQVFGEIPCPDIVSWNALIAGYAQHDQARQALNCFKQMKQEGFSPDAVTFSSLLKAYGAIRDIDEGEQVHDEIARQGLLSTNIVLGTALIGMYAKCGALSKAHQVLEKLPFRDVVTWNALISGYVQQGEAEQAVACFDEMQHEGLSPDAVTFSCILKAYGMMGSPAKVEQIYDVIGGRQLLGNDVVLSTALVDVYAKCGALAKAQHILEKLPSRNLVSWSALIAGYAQQGHAEQALLCFDQMKQEGFSPDAVTFVCILKACGTMGAIDRGEQVHCEIARHRLFGNNSMLGNALVDMYVKCGKLVKAAQVLEELPFLSVVAWNTLIAGCVQQGQYEQALNCSKQMQQDGLFPDEVTFACILKACASLGATDIGEQIHEIIRRHGMLGNNLVLGTALVDMYAKGGALLKAQQVLEELPHRDVASWSALIAGYAQWGQGKQVRKCLERMQCEGFSPNLVTFSCVLNACSRLGLVEDGYTYFVDMMTNYGLEPDIEHYSCLIDLLGRAGHLDKAIKVIEGIPPSHYPAAWSALLCACQKWGDVNVGKWAFKQVLEVDKNNTAAYVLMANIYAAAGMQEDAKMVNAMIGT